MSDSVNTRIESEEQLTNQLLVILKTYMHRFVYETYQDVSSYDNDLLEFQKKLYTIPKWSASKRRKEYGLFNKYVLKKYRLSENGLINLLNSVLISKIKILSNSHVDINFPSLDKFWYKIMKYVCKYFYEHPRDMRHWNNLYEFHMNFISNVILSLVYECIPFKNLFKPDNTYMEYNFNSDSITTDHESSTSTERDEVTHNSDISLQYISSEVFLKEMGNQILDPDESKHIKLLVKKK